MSELPPTAVEALRRGNKIEAIKIVRLEGKLDLKDAKDLVDDYVRHDPVLQRSLQQAQSEAQRGLMFWLVVLLALGLGAYYLLAGK
jgi:ribosomal protein L7/L12